MRSTASGCAPAPAISPTPASSAQDNDLILVDDPEAVARFERNFDEIWSRGTNAGAAGERERGGPR